MATTQEKAMPPCYSKSTATAASSPSVAARKAATTAIDVLQDWSAGTKAKDLIRDRAAMASLIWPVDSLTDPPPPPLASASSKGITVMARAQTSHPLEPLTTAEISVAVAIVRATGATPKEKQLGCTPSLPEVISLPKISQ